MNDVIVIGGGLAGGSAACLLARAGRRVTLFEKQPGAHDKVCGEFLSVETQHYLRAIGIEPVQLGAVPITRLKLTHKQTSIRAALPFQALSLSRRILDDAVLQRASASGAVVRYGSGVTSLARNEGHWEVTLQDGSSHRARTVFLATGKHTLRGHARTWKKPSQNIGFKQHYQRLDSQSHEIRTVEVILFDGGYAGLEPVEGNRLNLCLVVSRKRFDKADRDWHVLLDHIMQFTPSLARQLEQASPLWPKPLAIASIPYGFVHQPVHENEDELYRLGDQMAVIPSFTGDGMAIALHTAAQAVEHHLHGNAATYHRATARELSAQMRHARWLDAAVRSSFGREMLCHVVARFPGMLTHFADTTRLSSFKNTTSTPEFVTNPS